MLFLIDRLHASPAASLCDDDGRRRLAMPHLSDVLLHQLGADDADEAGVGAVGNGASAQRLAGAGWAVQEHALRRLDAQVDEPLRLMTTATAGRGACVKLRTDQIGGANNSKKNFISTSNGIKLSKYRLVVITGWFIFNVIPGWWA